MHSVQLRCLIVLSDDSYIFIFNGELVERLLLLSGLKSFPDRVCVLSPVGNTTKVVAEVPLSTSHDVPEF